jgi:hypothetical protein
VVRDTATLIDLIHYNSATANERAFFATKFPEDPEVYKHVAALNNDLETTAVKKMNIFAKAEDQKVVKEAEAWLKLHLYEAMQWPWFYDHCEAAIRKKQAAEAPAAPPKPAKKTMMGKLRGR